MEQREDLAQSIYPQENPISFDRLRLTDRHCG
jgi:hypothetical protein